MILVTGAAGKTGRAVIEALSSKGQQVRALVHRPEQIDVVREAGAGEVLAGDAGDPYLLSQAVKGVRTLYFISPNISPHEVTFGRIAIASALEIQRDLHFVYHSVLHPQTQRMPHHWLKLRVEELLFESGLTFTILQPAAYMQNLLAQWPTIIDEGIYSVPYGPETRISVVDLEDVAQAAAIVISESGHSNAVYELAGPEALSQDEVAAILTRGLDRQVLMRRADIRDWQAAAYKRGLGQYQIRVLSQMFDYYDRFGFQGNSRILKGLLGREPTDFAQFVARTKMQSYV